MIEHLKLSYKSDGDETLSLKVHNVGREKCSSLHQWGPGIRNFYLLHYIVSGKGTYTVGGKTYNIGQGSTFLIYPNTEITYCADSNDPWDYYWVGFNGNDARIIINQTDFTISNPVIDVDMNTHFESLLMDIYDAKGNKDSSKIKMTGYLMLALSLLVEKAMSSKGSHTTSSIYINKAMEFIELNYSQKLTVQEIAHYVGISRSQLYRVFMESYQKSPMQMILEYRILIACGYLKNSQMTISSIGYSVGFEDSLYFSRVFKKIKGMSPREYLQTIK
jgi:AraC-like DNA-binding protein